MNLARGEHFEWKVRVLALCLYINVKSKSGTCIEEDGKDHDLSLALIPP